MTCVRQFLNQIIANVFFVFDADNFSHGFPFALNWLSKPRFLRRNLGYSSKADLG
jgi:hypothetical protein